MLQDDLKKQQTPPVFVALDSSSVQEVQHIVATLGDLGTHYKIGLQAYMALGRSFVEKLLAQDKTVFLDLKFMDIPNTVRYAVKEGVSMGVSMLTVHALGGLPMLCAAVNEANEASTSKTATKILAVTYLTSLSQGTMPLSMQRQGNFLDQVLELAHVASEANVHGVVCSAEELVAVKANYPSLKALVPGIRPQGIQKQDQARTATPFEAKQRGADYLVVGRPITQAKDPQHVLQDILDELRDRV